MGGIMLDDEEEDEAGPAVEPVVSAGPTPEEAAAAEREKQAELDALFAAELGTMPVKKKVVPTQTTGLKVGGAGCIAPSPTLAHLGTLWHQHTSSD
jgi:hypothetical protein